jgi:hypothetical protein
MSHEILANKEIQMSDKPHRECVAYVNASPVGTPEPKPEPTPEPKPHEMTQVKT